MNACFHADNTNGETNINAKIRNQIHTNFSFSQLSCIIVTIITVLIPLITFSKSFENKCNAMTSYIFKKFL